MNSSSRPRTLYRRRLIDYFPSAGKSFLTRNLETSGAIALPENIHTYDPEYLEFRLLFRLSLLLPCTATARVPRETLARNRVRRGEPVDNRSDTTAPKTMEKSRCFVTVVSPLFPERAVELPIFGRALHGRLGVSLFFSLLFQFLCQLGANHSTTLDNHQNNNSLKNVLDEI